MLVHKNCCSPSIADVIVAKFKTCINLIFKYYWDNTFVRLHY